jgi:hypothetical protein
MEEIHRKILFKQKFNDKIDFGSEVETALKRIFSAITKAEINLTENAHNAVHARIFERVLLSEYKTANALLLIYVRAYEEEMQKLQQNKVNEAINKAALERENNNLKGSIRNLMECVEAKERALDKANSDIDKLKALLKRKGKKNV